MFDLIITGGSVAGMSAAIYCARRKLNFKMVTFDTGGEVAQSGVINNWPGIIEINGFELAKNFTDHVKSYGVEIDTGFKVEKIIKKENGFEIIAKDGAQKEKKYEAKAVIIATGIHPRKLKVPGEKEFDRKGVTYCSVCDGPLFKNKITATIGAGNVALESALMMAGIASKVYLITKFLNTPENKGGFPKGENILIDKVKALKNVEIIYGASTLEILGKKVVSGLKYLDQNKQEQTLALQGVMVHIGAEPNSQIIDGVDKTPTGEIIINQKCQTNIPGVFAAGDVTNIPYKQIGIASGQGITAALAAIEYLNRLK